MKKSDYMYPPAGGCRGYMLEQTTVKICAKWDGRCATWLASDPTMCLTCASGLYSTDMTKTINSTTISYVSCTQSWLDGKYTDASNKWSNSCLRHTIFKLKIILKIINSFNMTKAILSTQHYIFYF